jgi:hypothetical protein
MRESSFRHAQDPWIGFGIRFRKIYRCGRRTQRIPRNPGTSSYLIPARGFGSWLRALDELADVYVYARGPSYIQGGRIISIDRRLIR